MYCNTLLGFDKTLDGEADYSTQTLRRISIFSTQDRCHAINSDVATVRLTDHAQSQAGEGRRRRRPEQQ